MFLTHKDSMGWVNTVVTCPYNDRWRRYRKIVAQSFRKETVKQFFPTQEREAARFLGALLTEPENYMAHFRLWVYRLNLAFRINMFDINTAISCAARTFLSTLYGIEIKTAHDPVSADITNPRCPFIYWPVNHRCWKSHGDGCVRCSTRKLLGRFLPNPYACAVSFSKYTKLSESQICSWMVSWSRMEKICAEGQEANRWNG